MKNLKREKKQSKKHHIPPRKILKKFGYEKRYDYKLCFISELVQNGDPEDGKLYLEKKGNKLKYVVLSPKNKKVEAELDILVEGTLTQEFLDRKKSEILDITSNRGHTKFGLYFLFFPKEGKRIKHLKWMKEKNFCDELKEDIFFRENLMVFSDINFEDNNKYEEEGVEIILEKIKQGQLESISYEEKAALTSLIHDTLLKQNILELRSKRNPYFLIDHGYDYRKDDKNTFQSFRRKFLPDNLVKLNDTEYELMMEHCSIRPSKSVVESLLGQVGKLHFSINFMTNTSLTFIILSDQHASFAIGDYPIILGKEIVQNIKNITLEVVLNKICKHFYQTEKLRSFQYTSDLDYKKFKDYSGYGVMPLSKNVALMWEFKENKAINLKQPEIVTVEKVSNEDLNFSKNFNFLMYLLSYKGVAVGNNKAWTNLQECYFNNTYSESLAILLISILSIENV